MRRWIGACLLVLSAELQAQSTRRLDSWEPDFTIQAAVGVASPFIQFYGQQGGDLRAAQVIGRRQLDILAVRFGAWYLGGHCPDGCFAYGAGGPYSVHSSHVVAFVLSFDVPIRLGRDASIAPILGFGLAPFAHSSGETQQSGCTSGPCPPAAASASGSGQLFNVGFALRISHVIIEQHFLQLQGLDAVLSNGEKAPLTIGWRF